MSAHPSEHVTVAHPGEIYILCSGDVVTYRTQWSIYFPTSNMKSRHQAGTVNFSFSEQFESAISKMCAACHLILVTAKANEISWTDRKCRSKVVAILERVETK